MNAHLTGTWVDRTIPETGATYRWGAVHIRLERRQGNLWQVTSGYLWGELPFVIDAASLLEAKKRVLDLALQQLQILTKVLERAQQALGAA